MEVSPIESKFLRVIEILNSHSGFCKFRLVELADDTNQDVAIEILFEFINSVNAARETFLLKTSDQDQVYKACHKLLGSAEAVGFQKLGKMLRDQQSMLNQNSVEQKSKLSELALECEQILNVLQKCKKLTT
jgi:hypothetical protein